MVLAAWALRIREREELAADAAALSCKRACWACWVDTSITIPNVKIRMARLLCLKHLMCRAFRAMRVNRLESMLGALQKQRRGTKRVCFAPMCTVQTF